MLTFGTIENSDPEFSVSKSELTFNSEMLSKVTLLFENSCNNWSEKLSSKMFISSDILSLSKIIISVSLTLLFWGLFKPEKFNALVSLFSSFSKKELISWSLFK